MNFLKKGVLAAFALMSVASVQSQVVPTIPSPTTHNLAVCENSIKLMGSLSASVNATVGYPASDFELVWYKSKEDGTIDESQEYKEIKLDYSIQKVSEDGSLVTTYKYYVLQRLVSNPEVMSPAVPVTVEVYKNPRITKVLTDPKCFGEVQKLSEMINVDIADCDVAYYDASLGGTIEKMKSDVVKQSGVFEAMAHYTINKGTDDEEVCPSSPEDLSVVFHQIEVDIEGADATCPGVGVDLKADVDFKEGRSKDEVFYSWSNNLNATVGNAATYNTGSEGLENPGDMMKVNLEVSTAACKGDKAVKLSWKINVGNGPLNGYISFSEDNNTASGNAVIISDNMLFWSCGGSVEVDLSVSTDGGSYTLTGTETRSGEFNNGSAALSLGPGNYTFSYINRCPVKFDFEIEDHGIESDVESGNMEINEGDSWYAEVKLIKGKNPDIMWEKDGAIINGATGMKLTLDHALISDSGDYSYTLQEGGCIEHKALGESLKVKATDDVKNVLADPNGLVNVVDMNGILLKKQIEYKNALLGLQPGVYMVGGVKTIVK